MVVRKSSKKRGGTFTASDAGFVSDAKQAKAAQHQTPGPVRYEDWLGDELVRKPIWGKEETKWSYGDQEAATAQVEALKRRGEDAKAARSPFIEWMGSTGPMPGVSDYGSPLVPDPDAGKVLKSSPLEDELMKARANNCAKAITGSCRANCNSVIGTQKKCGSCIDLNKNIEEKCRGNPLEYRDNFSPKLMSQLDNARPERKVNVEKRTKKEGGKQLQVTIDKAPEDSNVMKWASRSRKREAARKEAKRLAAARLAELGLHGVGPEGGTVAPAKPPPAKPPPVGPIKVGDYDQVVGGGRRRRKKTKKRKKTNKTKKSKKSRSSRRR
jgi:hypothetical protein